MKLLDGIRYGDYNNVNTFPPNVEKYATINEQQQYLMVVDGPDKNYDIGSENLRFLISKSNFKYENSSGRWVVNAGIFEETNSKFADVGKDLTLDPIPPDGSYPIVKFCNELGLTPVQMTDETLSKPSSGKVAWSVDSGKILLNDDDVSKHEGKQISYDGYYDDIMSFARSKIQHPETDASVVFDKINKSIYVFGVKSGSPNYYFMTEWKDDHNPPKDYAYIDPDTGALYINQDSVSQLKSDGYDIYYVIASLKIDGAITYFYRSSNNTNGEPEVPDFTMITSFTDEMIVSELIPSHTVSLSPVPLTYSLTVEIKDNPNNNNDYTGQLSSAYNPKYRYNYVIDCLTSQLSMYENKKMLKVMEKDSPFINLDDSYLFGYNSYVKKNGQFLVSDQDYFLNAQAGIIEFIKPMGVGSAYSHMDEKAYFNGTILSLDNIVFTDSYVGYYVRNGSEYYKILSVTNGLATIDSNVTSGEATVDIIDGYEVSVENVLYKLNSIPKKFNMVIENSGNSLVVEWSDITVNAQAGQIMLSFRLKPGDKVTTTYTYVESDGSEHTTTEVAEWENSEVASISNGIITFNEHGNELVHTSIDVYVGGREYVSGILIKDNSHIQLLEKVDESKNIRIRYSTYQSNGGQGVVQLQNENVLVDELKTNKNTNKIVLNGKYDIPNNAAILIDNMECIIETASSYDSSNDETTIYMARNPTIESDNIMVSDSKIVFDGVVDESLVESIAKNSNSVSLTGQFDIPPNSIITVGGDSYIVSHSEFADGKTKVTVKQSFIKSYVVSSLLFTTLPVYQEGDSVLKPGKPIHGPSGLYVIRNGQKLPSSDYSYSDSSDVTLNSPIGKGDKIQLLYAYHNMQHAGDMFEVDYLYGIIPSNDNEILGQSLVMTFDVYSPDTFFYRTIEDEKFKPDVISFINSLSPSRTATGPVVMKSSSVSNYDSGIPGFYYNLKFLNNCDYFVGTALLYYCDIIDVLDNIVSNCDGTVVGGSDGKFRYDGEYRVADTIKDVKNDINDDLRYKLTSSISSMTPYTISYEYEYKRMYETFSYSRIYPQLVTIDCPINDKTGKDDAGEIIGSTGYANVTDVYELVESRPRVIFTSTVETSGQTNMFVSYDDNEPILHIKFGDEIDVYDGYGNKFNSYPVVYADDDRVIINGVLPFTSGSVQKKTITQDYVIGASYVINSETGEIKNAYCKGCDSYFKAIDENSVVKVTLAFNNSDTSPLRLPALFSSPHCDDGNLPEPLLFRDNEISFIEQEKYTMNKIGFGKVDSITNKIYDANGMVVAGDTIKFVNGPNSGQTANVLSTTGSSFIVDKYFSNADPTGSDFILSDLVYKVLDSEIDIISTNTYSSGNVDHLASQFQQFDDFVSKISDIVASGSYTVISSNSIGTNGVGDAKSGDVLYMRTNGGSRSIYMIKEVNGTSITIDGNLDFPVDGTFQVARMSMITSTTLIVALNDFMVSTSNFLDDTQAWKASVSYSGISGRMIKFNERRSDIESFLTSIRQTLKQLNEERYLWVKLKTDKLSGITILIGREEESIDDAIKELQQNQKVQLLMEKMSGLTGT